MRPQAKSKMRNTMERLSKRQQINMAAKDLQKLVRLRAANKDGFCRCVSCGKRAHWKTMNGGHFIAGRNSGVVLDERNVHAQCVHCNKWLSGNQCAYYGFMLKRYGQDVVDELTRLNNTGRDWSLEELVELRESYLDEIKELERSLA